MKVRIKDFKGDLPENLSLGKEYEIWTSSDLWAQGIRDDNHENVVLPLNLKEFHKGIKWEYVE